MSKEKIDPVQLYNTLREAYPDKFPELVKIPREVKHPGDQPPEPRAFEWREIVYDPNTSFEDFAKKLEEIGHSDDVMISVGREILRSESYERPDYVDDDTDDCDCSIHSGRSTADFTRCEYYRPAVYGKAEKIVFDFKVETPNFYQLQRKHDMEMKNWESRRQQYQVRKQEIKLAEDTNREMIHNACMNHRDLRTTAARHLKGKSSREWLEKKAEVARTQLSQIEQLLSEQSDVQEDNDSSVDSTEE